MCTGMNRAHPFWQHYLAQHPARGVLTFSASAAIGALLCLFLLACWTTAQVAARCGECEAIPARCRCAVHR
jgi:broad specificity phosphatase PhoE